MPIEFDKEPFIKQVSIDWFFSHIELIKRLILGTNAERILN
jgi:hypothetical protein